MTQAALGVPAEPNLLTIVTGVGAAGTTVVVRWARAGAHVARSCHRRTVLKAVLIESLIAVLALLVAIDARSLLSRRAL